MSEKTSHFLTNIYRYGKRTRLLYLYGQSVRFILILIVAWISLALGDSVFYFSELTRWGLFFVHTFLFVLAVYVFILKPLRVYLSFRQDTDFTAVARHLDNQINGSQENIVNTYHLIARSEHSGESGALKTAAIEDLLDKFKTTDFSQSLNSKRFFPQASLVLVIIISVIAIVAFKYQTIAHSSLRLLNPTDEYLIVPNFQFIIDPGNKDFIKGEKVKIHAKYQGPELESCILHVSDMKDEAQVTSSKMERSGANFTTELNEIQRPVRYQIKGIPRYREELEDHIWSEVYYLNVLTPPEVRNLDIKLSPPIYSGLQTQILDRNIGDVSGLVGTKAQLQFSSNKQLDAAELVFKSNERVALNIRGFSVSGEFILEKNGAYTIALLDSGGLGNINPIEYQVDIMPDLNPLVSITEPGQDVDAQLDQTLAVKAEISDDFGISRIDLYYQYIKGDSTIDSIWTKQRISHAGRKNFQEISYYWDFNKLPVTFEDEIKYFIEAMDNRSDRVKGIGRSQTFYIRFPSLEELFDTFADQQEEEVDKLDEVFEASENLQKELEDLNRELKRKKNLDWEQKKQIENALNKQQELQKKLDDIQKNLEELVKKLEENNIINEEILEKYQQLQELFRDVASPELMKAMQDLEKALKDNNTRQAKNAFEKFKLNQEAFMKNIERTMELLQQVQLEQKMDQLVQQAKKLAEQQDKITEKLDDTNKLEENDLNQISKNQDKQIENLSHLKKETEMFSTEPRLSQFEQSKSSLEKAKQQLSNHTLNQQMQQVRSELSKGNQSAAQQKSEQAGQQLAQIQQSLEQAQQQMLDQNKQQVMQKMARTLRRMLQLSHEQEYIKKSTEQASSLGDGLKESEQKQGQIKENYQKTVSDIIELSKETFFLDPKLGKSMNQVYQNIQQSLDHLSERNKSSAIRHQQQALAAMNDGVKKMRQSMSQLSQSQSGTGFEQFMEQMKKMAGMQGQINNETLGLMPSPSNQGKLSPQQQNAMQRLAGEQQALREAMQGLHEQMGNRDNMLGDMGNLAQQMEEVVQDLLKQNVDRKTIDRQRQILSRMLDAQKSLEQRKLSKKRKAQTAKEYTVTDPGELTKSVDEQRAALQRALKEALGEGYSSDYQKLIESYFKKLIEKSENNLQN